MEKFNINEYRNSLSAKIAEVNELYQKKLKAEQEAEAERQAQAEAERETENNFN